MRTQIRYWLDYDPVALVVLLVGIGMVELLALSIWTPPRDCHCGAHRPCDRGDPANARFPQPGTIPIPNSRRVLTYGGDLGPGGNRRNPWPPLARPRRRGCRRPGACAVPRGRL